MAGVNQGGGGGASPLFTANDVYALDKPYDVSGEPSADRMQQIDEMLRTLFQAVTFNRERVTDVEAATVGAGNVVGPASAVSGDVALYSGVTGKLISDSGKLGSDLVTGPAVAVSGDLVTFSGTTGKVIQDGGTFGAFLLASSAQLTKTITLNTSDIDTLNATPITIVSGAGANKIIIVVSWSALMTRSGQWTNGGLNWTLRYNGQVQSLAGTIVSTLNGVGAGNSLAVGVMASATLTGGSALANTAVELTCSADANPGAQTGSVKITMTYYIADIS